MPEQGANGPENEDHSEAITPAVDASELIVESAPEEVTQFSEEKIQDLLREYQNDFNQVIDDVNQFTEVIAAQAVTLHKLAAEELPRLQELADGTSLETSIKGLITRIQTAVKDMEEPDKDQPSKDTRAGSVEVRKQLFVTETLGSDSADTLLRATDTQAYRNNDSQLFGALDNLRFVVSSAADSYEQDIDAIASQLSAIQQGSLDITDAGNRSSFDISAQDLRQNVVEGVRRQIRQVNDDVRTELRTIQDRMGNRASAIYNEKFATNK